jgi:hypothetical protein
VGASAMLSESLEAQTKREVASIQCPVCQKEKKSGHPFCPRCYFSLSDSLKEELRYLVTTGTEYALAFEEAKDFVRQL